jgi:DnaA family protein
MQQLVLDLAPFAVQTFDSFIRGKNAEVLDAVRGIAHVDSNRFVYVWGAPGSGKTHLLNAAFTAVKARDGSAQHFEGALFYDSARCDLVVADNVQLLDDDAQSALFKLYNARREAGRATLVAGDAPPSRLPLRDDLRTRLAWELVYEVRVLDDEEKAEALHAHAKELGFLIPPDVVNYLLARGPRDLPALFATLNALDRYSLQNRRAITVPTLRDLMSSAEHE